MFIYEYETKRALSLREGDEFSIFGPKGPWLTVAENSMGDYYLTGKAMVRTRESGILPMPEGRRVTVRTKNWTPTFLGIGVGSIVALFIIVLYHAK